MKKSSLVKIIVFIVLSGMIILFICYLTRPYETRNIEDYVDKQNFAGHSGLLIFPDEMKESNAVDYYYFEKNNFLDNHIQLYLQCRYSETEFQQECDRLSEVFLAYTWKSGEKQVHRLNYNLQDYLYPAYEAIAGFGYCYEYAVIDEQNCTIYYIYLQQIDAKKVAFDKRMLPNNYGDNEERDRWNIYAFAVDGNTSDGAMMIYE